MDYSNNPVMTRLNLESTKCRVDSVKNPKYRTYFVYYYATVNSILERTWAGLSRLLTSLLYVVLVFKWIDLVLISFIGMTFEFDNQWVWQTTTFVHPAVPSTSLEFYIAGHYRRLCRTSSRAFHPFASEWVWT